MSPLRLKFGMTAHYLTHEDIALAAQRVTRGHRCNRRTKAGTVCRMRAALPGDACEWHTGHTGGDDSV